MVNINVRITGLKEIERKLGYPILAAPAMQEALEKIAARPFRISRRGRRQLGILNNVLSKDVVSNGFRISSTLNHPRQKGTAWTRYNIAAIKSMTPNVLRSAARRIEAEFAR